MFNDFAHMMIYPLPHHHPGLLIGSTGVRALRRQAAPRQDALDAMDRYFATLNQEREHRKSGDFFEARDSQHISGVKQNLD